MRPWRDPVPVTPSPDVIAAVGGSLLAASALTRRGITTLDAARRFLDPDAYTPSDPLDLPDMAIAVARIRAALDHGEPIAVWGDFDVDGQTATALLTQALSARGGRVLRHIPDRARDGHGLQIPALARLIDSGARLFVTCDTGIAAHDAIAYANERGASMIVTDHHQLADTLPPALANINPQRLPHDHPMRTLPGVGVALQVIRALDDSPEAITPLLDLVALGIVADVAVQTGDSRYWLQRGLRALRAGLRPGLAALAETAGLEAARIDEGHIGFVIAPRLNAAGRLGDAMLGVDLLLESDGDRARTIALTLENLNAQRRLLVDQIDAGAEAQIVREPVLRTSAVLILSAPDWHPGVVGIVANRLVERYNVPVILLVTEGYDGEARGSARSVEGVDITAALGAHANLITGYGGHTMAAGLRLPMRNIAPLRRALDKSVRESRGQVTIGERAIDAIVGIADMTVESAEALARLAPFGAGNPPLLLAIPDLTLREHQMIGRGGEHRALIVEDASGAALRALWWDSATLPLPGANALDTQDTPGGRFDLACTLRASTYKGARRVEVEYIDSRPAVAAIAVDGRRRTTATIHDLRADSDKTASLLSLRADHPDLLVWREGGDPVAGVGRHELTTTSALAIWTTPAVRGDLVSALARVGAQTVFVYAVDPPINGGTAFRKRFLALIKYAISEKDGFVGIDALTSALATTDQVVLLALAWAVRSGAISTQPITNDRWRVALGTGAVDPALATAEATLTTALDEVTSFRAFFRRADLARLLDGR